MKIAVIVDHGRLKAWQQEALDQLDDQHEIALVLNCTNTVSGKRRIKHLLYYALNLFTIRNRETTVAPLSRTAVPNARWHDFRSQYRRAWQALPDDVIQLLRESGVDATVKFGMGLLIVPPPEVLPIPILSYHHGNPEKYRGRPAGFYEIQEGEDVVGVMVQQISNELDAGQALAYAESVIFPHSYRKTLIGHYRLGRHLLNVALRNLAAGRTIDLEPTGRNYRLPGNALVARFVLREWTRKLQRAFYGAFVEKAWRVSMSKDSNFEAFLAGEQVVGERPLTVDKRFWMYADPFLVDEDVVVVEALSKRTGFGALVLVDPSGVTQLTSGAEHYSYPCVIRDSGRTLVLPEIASWSSPRVYELEGSAITEGKPILLGDGDRVIDPTYHRHDGLHFIFGNKQSVGAGQLFLWQSDRLHGPYEEIPANPICATPRGARMAGQILVDGDRMLRLGQNGCGRYGDGLFVYEVLRLGNGEYEEKRVGELRFRGTRGPHTVNTLGETLVWDWYEDRISPLAGVRRLRRLMQNRRG